MAHRPPAPVESLALSALAGGAGLLVAYALASSLRDMRVLSWFPDLAMLEIDSRVLLFCLATSVLTVLVFGVLPALMASRTDIRATLGRGGRTLVSPHRLRSGLVVAQIALSLTLVTGAGVLNRSLQNLFGADLGANVDQVIELSLRPYFLGYDDKRSARVLADAMDALRRQGFPNLALSFPEPLTSNGSTITVRTPAMAATEERVVVESSVTPTYFDVLRIPLLSGRALTESEYSEPESVSPMPVVLNATLARDLFGDAPAVGRTFELGRSIGMREIAATALVIGVASDTRSSQVRGTPRGKLYHAREAGYRFGSILVKSRWTAWRCRRANPGSCR